jgi:hypothetical protein
MQVLALGQDAALLKDVGLVELKINEIVGPQRAMKWE